MAPAHDGPMALNEDGTAKDPVAFQSAIKADPVRLAALEKEGPEVGKIVLGSNINALQELLKSVHAVSGGPLDKRS